MNADQGRFEWHEDPKPHRGNVNRGALAWCDCGWRVFFTAWSATDARTKKRINEVAMAEDAFRDHRRHRCPVLGVVNVAPSEAVA